MIAVLAIMVSGCQKYNDSELRKEIDGLKTRLAAVEALNNYKDLLQKLDNGKTVTGVSESNGVFTLTFDDNSSITFNQKGEPGAPGESIPGPEGQPGVTPKFRINEETTSWEVSYDEGNSWTPVGSAIDRSLIWDVTLAEDGDSITITLADGTNIVVPCDDPNAVDLGLSVKWAKCNLGATSPEEYGGYYAWAELETKTEYSWATYKYCEGVEKTFTRYCKFPNYGTPDMIEFLLPEDDVVMQTLGGKWRIPTFDELSELKETKNNPDYTWELSEINGHTGYWVTYKVNGNKIFFPAPGCYGPSGLEYENKYGIYWTSRVDFSSQGAFIFSVITDPKDRNFASTPGVGYWGRHYGAQHRRNCSARRCFCFSPGAIALARAMSITIYHAR